MAATRIRRTSALLLVVSALSVLGTTITGCSKPVDEGRANYKGPATPPPGAPAPGVPAPSKPTPPTSGLKVRH